MRALSQQVLDYPAARRYSEKVRTQAVVSIVPCADYGPADVRVAVEEAVHLAGLDDVLQQPGSALLKPNLLSSRKPDEAVTTHPVVVEATGEVLRRAGFTLTLGDSPPFAGENPAKYARLLQTTGMEQAAARLRANIVRFEEDPVKLHHAPGRFYKTFEVGRAVLETDVLVNIPKLKTHGLTAFTGAVKNLFGCVPGIRKGIFHVQAAEDRLTFAQMLVDLMDAIRPEVSVMDAIVGMEGRGPNSGKPRRVGAVMASSDPVALDAVACAAVGIDPLSVLTTRLASEQGLGCGELSLIEVRGASIEQICVRDFEQSPGGTDWSSCPALLRRFLRRQLPARPEIDADQCTGCGDCISACPAGAMSPGRPPAIDLDTCIRCYCCAEVCNHGAVELKRGFLGRLLTRSRKR